ncbi:MAG: DMT family transporter [Flavobacteriaceae bacterium]
MSKRNLAILSALGATTIYGLNHTIAKGVMPFYIQPFGFIMLRVIGACILFWGVSFFGPKEKVERSDWGRFLLCAIFGMVINMLAFFKGLQLSTPINSAVLVTTTPIIVVLLSIFLIKEKVRFYRGVGIVLGLIGAIILVLYGHEIRDDAPDIKFGNILFLVNATSFALYLILAKKLVAKYHVITLMKWLFLIGVIINIPVALTEFLEVRWLELPLEAALTMVFVVVGTTFCAYLFNVFALTQLKASTVSSFIYLQPVIGILFAVLTGKDQLTVLKVGAACLVLLGVYLVSRQKIPDQ